MVCADGARVRAGVSWSERPDGMYLAGARSVMCPISADPTDLPRSSELIWDEEQVATASARFFLHERPGTDWTPALLLATAAGASLLRTFVEITDDAQVPILSCVAQQQADVAATTKEVSSLTLSVCVTVPSAAAATAARAAWKLAIARAPVLRVLACPVHCEPSIVILENRHHSARSSAVESPRAGLR
jgi:hypothetical protein